MNDMCPVTGKRSYPNGAAATREARKLKRHNHGSARLRAYRCPHCGRWHLGNGNKRDNLREQKRRDQRNG